MEVLARIERFLRKADMPPTTFGRLAVNDPRLISDLRAGREAGSKIIARIDAFIAGFGK